MSDLPVPLAAIVACTAAVSCGVTFIALHFLQPAAPVDSHQHQQGAATPEPDMCQPGPVSTTSSSRWQQPTTTTSLFSPVNKQKRPDPYDPRPRSSHLSWDDYFMALAFLSAERSKDPNKQVGACIVNDDNIILSIGYNGFPRGCADTALPWSKRAASGSILDTKYPYVVHAEANALLNKNQAHVTGARIYVTLFPCNECAKLLIQAGIKEVIFHEAKLEPTGKRPGIMEQAAAADEAADSLAERLEKAPQPTPTPPAADSGQAADTGEPGASSSNGSSRSECNLSHDSSTAAGGGTEDAACCSYTSIASSALCEAAGLGDSGSCQCAQAPKSNLQQQEQQQALGQSSEAQQRQQLGKRRQHGRQAADGKFGVGAIDDVDASYAASQKLLMLAGVKLRQHTLQRCIHLGPRV